MKASNGVLIAAATLVAILSLVIGSQREDAEFSGADGQAMATVATLNPDYRPWFSPLWKPPSGEVEGLLFALQAALGSGLLGYYLGLRRGQARSQRRERVDADD